MLRKLQLIASLILAIILAMLVMLGIIAIITKDDPNINDPIPPLTKQEQKTLNMEIETQSIPIPGINE